jgi:hypothetical protein
VQTCEEIPLSLKDIANDLNVFLAESSSTHRVVTEAEYSQLGRSVVNYVLSQADSDDSPEIIGEAMVVGAQAAASDTEVGADEAVEATIRVIERMAESMRRMQ